MFIRDQERLDEIVAGDDTRLREIYNPLKDPVDVRHSLAIARVAPGQTTLLHRLECAEVYYIIEGRGTVRAGAERSGVHPGQAVYIPPGARQQITNDGDDDLVFLCVVDPAWRPEIEALIREDGEVIPPGPRRPESELGFVSDAGLFSDDDFDDLDLEDDESDSEANGDDGADPAAPERSVDDDKPAGEVGKDDEAPGSVDR